MTLTVIAHGMVKPSKPSDDIFGKEYNLVHNSFSKRSVQPSNNAFSQSSNVIIDLVKKSISFLHSDLQQSSIPSNLKKRKQYAQHYDVTTNLIETQKWRQKIGFMLAIHFNLPEPCEQWTISSFPANYCFIKVESITIRNKKYTYWRLYGKDGSTFQSSDEFFVHAIWLLSERRQPCQCKYCHGSDKWQKIVKNIRTKCFELQNTGELQKSEDSSITISPSKSSNGKDSIRKQSAPRTEILPGIPFVSRSPSRLKDLSKLQKITNCEHEGYREQEIAFVTLSSPIEWFEDNQRKAIDSWPVLITEVGFTPYFEETSSAISVRVKHRAQYKVLLLGTKEEIQVDSVRLQPAINNRLLKSSFSKCFTLRDVQERMRSQKKTVLNLENGRKRAKKFEIICTLLAHLLILHQKRKQLEATDGFNNHLDCEEAVKSKQNKITLPASAKNEQIRKKSISCEDGDVSEKEKEFFFPTQTATGNESYSTLGDDDDSSTRRRRILQKSITPSMEDTKKSETIDANKYWTGLYFGFERIWVGDVVRICMTEFDLRKVIDSLAVKNDLNHPMDRSMPDLQSPLVMRIKAIYQVNENANLSIAGDLYRIVNKTDAKRSFTEFNERIAENQDELYQNQDIQPNSHSSSYDTYSFFRYGSNSHSLRLGDSTDCAPSLCREPISQLPASNNGQLPPSPCLPEQFGYQRINQANVEIVVGISNIAGRLYCSMANQRSKIDPTTNLAGKVRELQILAKNTNCSDIEDKFQSNLCLAGLLPGSKLSMGVKSCHPFKGSRNEAFERATSDAIASLEKHLSKMEKVTLNNLDQPRRASYQLTSEFGKRKKDSEQSGDAMVKRSRSEQLETMRKHEHPTPQPESSSKSKAAHPTTPEYEKESEYSGNNLSTSQSSLDKESNKSQQAFKIFASTPPGFERNVSETASRIYYRNPETGEVVWGRKVSLTDTKI